MLTVVLLLLVQIEPPEHDYAADLANVYCTLFVCCNAGQIETATLRLEVERLTAYLNEHPPHALAECMTGPTDPGVLYLHVRMLACSVYDLDGDGDIDLADYHGRLSDGGLPWPPATKEGCATDDQ